MSKKVIDIKRLSDRFVDIKLLVQLIITSVISIFGSNCDKRSHRLLERRDQKEKCLVYKFNVRKVKDSNKFVSRRRIPKLYQDNVNSFSSCSNK